VGGAFKIGRVAGIDLKVHWTFFLLLAYFAFAGYQGSGSLTNALITALVIVALFVCVVLHEYGHSLVAQRLGIEIQDITVLPIGGIFFGASGESQMVRQQGLTRGLTVSEVMGTKPRTETVTPSHTFGQVLDSVIHGYQEDFPVLDESGKLLGMITRDEIMPAAHSPERYSSVRDLMKTNVPTISSKADLFEDGLRILQQSGLRALPVTENAELVGMLTIEDVGNASLLGPLPRKPGATAMTVEKERH
jgi:CBS domain-containing protein